MFWIWRQINTEHIWGIPNWFYLCSSSPGFRSAKHPLSLCVCVCVYVDITLSAVDLLRELTDPDAMITDDPNSSETAERFVNQMVNSHTVTPCLPLSTATSRNKSFLNVFRSDYIQTIRDTSENTPIQKQYKKETVFFATGRPLLPRPAPWSEIWAWILANE